MNAMTVYAYAAFWVALQNWRTYRGTLSPSINLLNALLVGFAWPLTLPLIASFRSNQ